MYEYQASSTSLISCIVPARICSLIHNTAGLTSNVDCMLSVAQLTTTVHSPLGRSGSLFNRQDANQQPIASKKPSQEPLKQATCNCVRKQCHHAVTKLLAQDGSCGLFTMHRRQGLLIHASSYQINQHTCVKMTRSKETVPRLPRIHGALEYMTSQLYALMSIPKP